MPPPTYEYECRMGHTFEVEQKITDEPLEACTHLNTIHDGERKEKIECCSPVKRLLFPSMVRLKGGGWANDGYSKKAAGNS